MNYSKTARKLAGKINEFSGYVSTKLDKTAKRFIGEGIYGILSSQSVLLTEMGRSLDSDLPLKKIEERYCRQLNKQEIWQEIHRNILRSASPKIKENSLLILDLGDIEKKYADKMQYLAKVRDGSQQGAIVKGYWTNQVIAAELNSREVIPLYSDLYSQNSPGFKSENEEIIRAIDMVSSHTSNRGIWVIDRGGDREVLYNYLLSKNDQKRFIIRMVGSRDLIYNNKRQNALKLAEQIKCPYKQTIVKEDRGKEKVYHISYGYLKVKLPGHVDKQLYMLVVKGFGNKPMMILTTEPLRRNREVLQRILESYLTRWKIEETIRFIKQGYDLENIRILTYRRLKNMMALLLAVFYFIAVILNGSYKLKILVGNLLYEAKRVFGIPNFLYYAIGDGLSTIFNRSPNKIRVKKNNWSDQLKLNFGGT